MIGDHASPTQSRRCARAITHDSPLLRPWIGRATIEHLPREAQPKSRHMAAIGSNPSRRLLVVPVQNLVPTRTPGEDQPNMSFLQSSTNEKRSISGESLRQADNLGVALHEPGGML